MIVVVKDVGIIMDNNGLDEVMLVAFDGRFNGAGVGGGGAVVEERRIPSLRMSSSSEQVEARASN